MLLGRLKTEGVLEVVHHVLYMCLGSPCQNLFVGLGISNTLEISSYELIWSRHLLNSEYISSDGVKYMVRVLVHYNRTIAIEGHIVSFVSHVDVTSSHGRDKAKICKVI